MVKFINKSEFKYIAIASVFSFVYFLYILPFLLSKGAENWSPIAQFLIFFLGVYIAYFFVAKSFALKGKVAFVYTLVSAIPFIAMDLIQPEYHINLITGALEKGAVLGSSSSDYLLGSIGQSLGLSGYILVPFVYFFCFMLLLLIVAMIKKNFVEEDIR